MTKEMAQAMLVAQRYAETRMTASSAKDAVNNLLYASINLTEDDKKKIYDFTDFCQELISKNSPYEAQQYIKGLGNG
jgi:hypothetical protein